MMITLVTILYTNNKQQRNKNCQNKIKFKKKK